MLAAISHVGRRFARPRPEANNHRQLGALTGHLLKDVGLDRPRTRWAAEFGHDDRRRAA